EQSSEALKSKRLAELHSRLQFRFKAGEAQVKVPGSIYSECNILGEEAVRQVLLDFIAEHKIPDPDEAAITQLIEDNQSHFHFLTIRTFDTVELNHRGAQIHIRKSEDLMEAEALIFHGRNGARLQEVFNVLQAAGIVKGIRKKSIEKVLRSRHCGFFEIAKGCPAIDDRPGDIEKYFHEDEHKEFAKMMEALTIDTRSVKDINIADRNQLLMTIGDIVPGSDGYSIDGAVLRKKVLVEASAGLRMGKNVYASDDGKQVFSKQSGHIVWKADEGLIDVEPLYIVEGNVDFSEGNIIGFVGKVMIKGDVKPKFSVIAEGDIEIHGKIEDAIVRSTTGNIRVAGGIVNNSGGHVEAKE
ncbi:MAG: DUF342 domain-containing protein, partial [Chlamydiia bacterium]|nr:DUF342 domain-containing protein [Chlamydiia bacterium]